MRFITVLSEHRDLSCYLAAYLKVCIAAHIVLNNVWLLRLKHLLSYIIPGLLVRTVCLDCRVT
jgi:hypothetical protein